ncbi:NUDIX hydrolase [Caldibacillus lycopersici]|uniref:NUDIX hydrolase n=1 Tax=Perspicuibacillus lycopersici TaxID=1325689 RepID=A0AAE3LPI4_9BACI|nr:NUDIX hydrolase [Perspicuibacillus lycopersici]MCU9614982.1 NUDIX hydrolase [Perspicuibacillus lycopersici]
MGYVEDLRKIVGHRPLILVGAVTIIVDESGRILLQQRTYPKEVWGLPGGLMELGESTEETAKREVLEETGLLVENLQLIGVYSGSHHFVRAENGDEFYSVTTAYHTRDFAGEIRIDTTESFKAEFFSLAEFPEKMVRSHKNINEDYVKK